MAENAEDRPESNDDTLRPEESAHRGEPGSPARSPANVTDEQWSLFAHLASFAGYLLPLGNIVGPLAIWLSKRNDSAFVDRHGAAALNFQISLTIYFIVSFFLTIVFIGVIGIIAVIVIDLVYTIVNMVHASNGRDPRYPLTIRFVK